MSNAARRHKMQSGLKAGSKAPVAKVEETNLALAMKDAENEPIENLEAAEAILDKHESTPPAPAAEPESPAPVAPQAAQPTKKEKVMPTFEEALATAKKENPGRYAHVLRVTELTTKGEPKRVVIKCSDPQTKFVGTTEVSVCEVEREIAVQDLFQVTCCAACAARKVRKARRNRTKIRNKNLRKMAQAMKGK